MITLKAGRERSRGDARDHVAAAHAGKGMAPLTRITLFSLRHPFQASLAVGATIIAATLQLTIPRLLGQAIDQAHNVLSVAGEGAQQALLWTALTLLAASVARGLFTLVQNYFAESVGHHVGYELRLAFYDKVQRLSYSYHDRVHSGDLITIGLLDLDGLRMFFSTGLVRTILLAVLIGVGAWMLLSTDVLLGFLALSFVPFVAWRSSVAQLTLRATWLILQQKLSVLTRVMEENLGGIRVVRAFSGQKHELNKFDTASKDALELAHRRVRVRVKNTSMMTFSFFAAMGLVLWVGGNKVIAEEMTVGTLASFLTFMTILQMPVRQLGLMVNSYARASTCGERLVEEHGLGVLHREMHSSSELLELCKGLGDRLAAPDDVHIVKEGHHGHLLVCVRHVGEHGMQSQCKKGRTERVALPHTRSSVAHRLIAEHQGSPRSVRPAEPSTERRYMLVDGAQYWLHGRCC